ncbi:hypothetical protein A9Q91_01650 [Candidatus Gracilibacteria bacterium 28_42_T64]|nr:hypothetical protein A9Q91_01650 [Candidatus Gracilibacteria bacterium 28_42_T64]
MVKKKLPGILEYFIHDQLEDDPSFSYRSMFGGYGIYRYGKIFSILLGNQLYFKVGENNRQDYLDYGSEAFKYKKKTGVVGVMSYYELPEDVMENRELLFEWIEKSLSVETKTKKKTQKDRELDKKILEFLQEIPKGKVSSYKNLGIRFEVHPRKIASVMKYNKSPGIYPCYKVLADSGKLSGYNTDRGVEEKVEKLQADGIEIINGTVDKKYFI